MEAETHSAAELRPPSTGWRFSPSGIALRLFITCWLIYVLHFATNTVREIYLALAIGDHFSFRVDEYAHMHPDLFEKEGYGWHIGANPGASMIAAVPYAVARPLIDGLVERTNQRRAAAGLTEPPAYNSPWPMAREFYREAWRRGYDVKFGLGAFVIQAFCMAPISALGVVAMFFALRRVFDSARAAFWLALLYAFGTPVFFRTGYLNHNLMLGHVAFWGFLALWNPAGSARPSARMRYLLAGLSGGAAVLLDYSGVILLVGLLVYGVFRIEKKADSDPNHQHTVRTRMHRALLVGLGAIGPIILLWFYQWRSFGHPFYPGQHWMPPVEWIELGYQGFTWPQLDLLAMLAFDYRFGLFVSSPIMLLALAAPFVNRGQNRRLDRPELAFVLLVPLALWLFFGGVHYTKLQYGTGIRYLSTAFPFLFVAVAVVLTRLPRPLAYFIGVASLAQSWCLAMYRDVERGWGMAEPILHVVTEGLQLPALSVLSRMEGQYGDYFVTGASPLLLFVLTAMILYGVWLPSPRKRTAGRIK